MLSGGDLWFFGSVNGRTSPQVNRRCIGLARLFHFLSERNARQQAENWFTDRWQNLYTECLNTEVNFEQPDITVIA